MAKRSFVQSASKPNTGGWDALIASVDDLLRRRPDATQISPSESSHTVLCDRIERGLCVVPMYRIALDPHTEAPFEHWLAAEASPTPKRLPDGKKQSIELYKVGETYFVRAGNEHIIEARSRSQLFLRAHVVEYTIETAARMADILPLLVEQERAQFFARMPFPAAHPAHNFQTSMLGRFDALANHIEHTRPALQHSLPDYHSQLLGWYDRVYLPVARLTRRRHIMAHFPAFTEVDLFLWAINRNGPPTETQSLHDRLHSARYNIASLWVALQKR